MRTMLTGAAFGFALTAATAMLPAVAAATDLTVVTAGDQNMVDYINDYLAPRFEKENPGVHVRAVGTGPGDAGSQKILEKLDAEAKAGKESFDIDVAVVHEKAAGKLVADTLVAPYRSEIATGGLATRDTVKRALGADVDGYVMPMFHSQTAIAYNPALVTAPPKSYDDVVAFAKAHPKAFGYNGIKGGMSGVAFVVGWIYAYGGDADTLMKGPYDKAEAAKWTPAFEKLKAFNADVTMTPGNAGTLDMLNRGEIAMGPVWVDMFYTWQADGRLSPDLKLSLIAPGMPGQPMYYVIPAKTPNKVLAEKFIALATSPEVQADGIVKRFNWYPGIDAPAVQAKLDEATWAKLFTDISPAELATLGKPFPIAPYFTDILENSERQAMN
ncbi:ABC transporter substrate-binding protein [Segnochrobactrum spirostomi]|uniref:Extracellular solute-binding protein n=1 Tax=Segnochrobactrum spirostomi TaxID=2608987 RepID=A0A6A7Y276_9HYPH|nr:extracellular solute-binding protein [Segnochrobactrum spirostomi]MQT13154.1 extracellular solute-binding protein [Segnochrobactrum spirostomi]